MVQGAEVDRNGDPEHGTCRLVLGRPDDPRICPRNLGGRGLMKQGVRRPIASPSTGRLASHIAAERSHPEIFQILFRFSDCISSAVRGSRAHSFRMPKRSAPLPSMMSKLGELVRTHDAGLFEGRVRLKSRQPLKYQGPQCRRRLVDERSLFLRPGARPDRRLLDFGRHASAALRQAGRAPDPPRGR